ncbi:hypothetical protein, partial [Escherichia marmotae]
LRALESRMSSQKAHYDATMRAFLSVQTAGIQLIRHPRREHSLPSGMVMFSVITFFNSMEKSSCL